MNMHIDRNLNDKGYKQINMYICKIKRYELQ
jgi:hypothetical protein